MDTLNDWFPTEEVTVDCDTYHSKQHKTMPEAATEMKSLQLTPEITEAINLGLQAMVFKNTSLTPELIEAINLGLQAMVFKNVSLTPELIEALNIGLRLMLSKGILEVDFIKVSDGSTRTMKCTLDEDYTPEVKVDPDKPAKAPRPFNPEVVPVFELTDDPSKENGWRSFRIDSITAVRKIEPLA